LKHANLYTEDPRVEVNDAVVKEMVQLSSSKLITLILTTMNGIMVINALFDSSHRHHHGRNFGAAINATIRFKLLVRGNIIVVVMVKLIMNPG
jgi:hypothetical protein